MAVHDLVVPGTRFTNWRLRSRACAVADLIVVAAGASLLAPEWPWLIANWTAVLPSQYQEWQAGYVREDGIFTFFGLVLVVGGLGLVQLHRAAKRAPAP